MSFRTEYDFTLPKGYVDEKGNVHRDGVMRIATAADEIVPMNDFRVRQNPGYLPIARLSRVITKLGNLHAITPKVIENMYASDLTFLLNMYKQINETESLVIDCWCPDCGHKFKVPIEFNKNCDEDR